MVIKTVLLLFILFVVVRTVIRFYCKEVHSRELVVWLVFWGLVSFAVATPKLTDVAANLLGVSRGADLLVYISVLVLFYVVFRISIKLEKIDKALTKVVRKEALEELDEK